MYLPFNEMDTATYLRFCVCLICTNYANLMLNKQQQNYVQQEFNKHNNSNSVIKIYQLRNFTSLFS